MDTYSTHKTGEVDKILLVTKDSFIADSFSLFFLTRGYFLQKCATQPIALDILKNHVFSLILIDSDEKGLCKLGFCQLVHNLYPSLGKVLLVDYTKTPDAQVACNAGVDDWIEKPFNIDSAERIIFRLLKKRRLMLELQV